MVTKFQARHATIAYSSSAETWDSGTQLNDEALTANVAEAKDVTVTPPVQSSEQIPLLGATAQTLGANHRTSGTATGPVAATFQNAFLQIGNATNWKMEGTLVLTGDEQFVDVLGLDSGAQIDSNAATRYAVGNIASNDFAKNMLGTMRVFCNNGSEEFTVVMTNVNMVLGAIKPTGADGHFEREFTCECLPKDGAIEWLN